MDSPNVVLRTHSHRANDRLDRMLGYSPQRYFKRDFTVGGVFVVLTAEEAGRALEITGVKRTRVKANDLFKCWH